MPSQAVLRLLDTFFRRPLLYAVPFILMVALGAFSVAGAEVQYRSNGVLLVEDRTFLSSLTGVRGPVDTWQSPAAYASGQLQSLLQTDAFLKAVVEESGLADPAAMAPSDLAEVRGSLHSWDAGDNLMHVAATRDEPRVAQALATATIETFVQWQIDAEVSQSTAAEGFISPLTEQYSAELEEAREALQQYLSDNPAPEEGDRPGSEQVIVDGLTEEVDKANARFADALAKAETAQLATEQVESDVRSRLRLVDAPQLSTEPMGRLRDSIVTLVGFLAVGALLSLGLVVAAALVDRTLRFPQEVQRHVDLEVLAVLPDVSAWGPPMARQLQ